MKKISSIIVIAVLAAINAGCNEVDMTLTPVNIYTAAQGVHNGPGFGCLATLGTGTLASLAPAGQIAVGSIHGVGSGCLTGDESGDDYDRGAIKFDLSKISPFAIFSTMDLSFQLMSSSGFDTTSPCQVAIGLSTVDFTGFTGQDNQGADALTSRPLAPLFWNINRGTNALPQGDNVKFGFDSATKMYTYTVDLKPAFNFWSPDNKNRMGNNGLIFYNSDERLNLNTSAQCYEYLGNFSLHLVFSNP